MGSAPKTSSWKSCAGSYGKGGRWQNHRIWRGRRPRSPACRSGQRSPNMGAELGATTSYFPSDEATRPLPGGARTGRMPTHRWRPTRMPNMTRSSGSISTIWSRWSPCRTALTGSIDGQGSRSRSRRPGSIGSCTNSSFAGYAQGRCHLEKQIHSSRCIPGDRAGIRQVLLMLADGGALSEYRAAGAAPESPLRPLHRHGPGTADQCRSPRRNNNRNFPGRSGTVSAGVYLVSPGSCRSQRADRCPD